MDMGEEDLVELSGGGGFGEDEDSLKRREKDRESVGSVEGDGSSCNIPGGDSPSRIGEGGKGGE